MPKPSPIARFKAHVAAALGFIIATASTAFGGDGIYDPATHTFRFGISVRFQATPQQMTHLRDVFTRASALIYDATDSQQRFSAISISNNSESGSGAEFWIVPDGRSVTVGRFGIQGDRCYLSYTDLIATSPSADGAWVVAHEFAHLAYGLGDEFAGPGATNGRRCISIGNPANQTACLMDDYWTQGSAVGGVSEFCVEANHDPDHDTWQEELHGTSCWETIVEQYPDLVAPAGLPAAGPGAPAAPTWTVLTRDRRYLVILDKSGSMIGERLEMAKLGARVFANLAREGDKVGLMSFSWDPVLDAPLAPMNASNRSAFRQAVAGVTSDNGATGMGWALLHGHNHVIASGANATDMAVLLLSDGQANHGPDPASFGTLYQDSGVAIHTLALGAEADTATMGTLASRTGGRSYASATPFGLVPIFVRLLAEVTEGGLLVMKDGFMLAGQERRALAAVDETITTATFVAAWNGVDEGQSFELRGPSGQVFQSTTAIAGLRHERDATSIVFTLEAPALEAGDWTLVFHNPVGAPAHQYSLSAIGYSEIVDLAARSDRSSYTWPQPMRITGTAIFRSPLAGLRMEAEVRRPYGPPIVVPMNDDGLAGDDIAQDGIYTGSFDRWNGNGGYGVDVRAINDGSAVRIAGAANSPSAPSASNSGPFARVQPFGVTVIQAPKILHSFLCVEKASFKVDVEDKERGSLSIAGCFDASRDDLSPETDDLLLRVGELEYSIPAGSLARVGTKDRFTYSDAEERYRIDIELFVKGSSRARFKLSDKGVFASQLGSLDEVTVSMLWGAVDVEQTILPEVSVPEAQAKFSAKKQLVVGDEFAILKLDLRDESTPLGDRISLSARVQGDLRPDEQALTFRFGPFEQAVDATAWQRKGDRYTLRLVDGSRRMQATYDQVKRTFKLKASGFDFEGLEAQASVGFGTTFAFNEFRELDFATDAGRYVY